VSHFHLPIYFISNDFAKVQKFIRIMKENNKKTQQSEHRGDGSFLFDPLRRQRNQSNKKEPSPGV
jgi:hypothetical protein